MSPVGDGASGVTVRAPAKVNLFLRILAREASGYHQLETLFQGIELHDTVRVERCTEPGAVLEVVEGGASVDDLGPVEENLAYRAAESYRMWAGLEEAPGVRIRLEKVIPAGAGMGGGSSDAAAVLRALQVIHEGALDRDALMSVAAELGSDVPFFLGPGPLALAWGRGERLLSVPPLKPRPVVVAVPSFRISTADAYRRLARMRAGRDEGAAAPSPPLTLEDVSSWSGAEARAANDFESVVLPDRPEATEILELLASAGASPALLSGSGSALFGVFSGREAADAAADRLRSAFPRIRVLRTSTLDTWPAIVTS